MESVPDPYLMPVTSILLTRCTEDMDIFLAGPQVHGGPPTQFVRDRALPALVYSAPMLDVTVAVLTSSFPL